MVWKGQVVVRAQKRGQQAGTGIGVPCRSPVLLAALPGAVAQRELQQAGTALLKVTFVLVTFVLVKPISLSRQLQGGAQPDTGQTGMQRRISLGIQLGFHPVPTELQTHQTAREKSCSACSAQDREVYLSQGQDFPPA